MGITTVLMFNLASTLAFAKGESYNIKRLSGSDRYDTAIEIAREYTKDSKEKLKNIFLSTGTGFADALCGGILAFKKEAPILLVDSTVDGSKKTLDYIEQSLDKDGTVYILGEVGVISNEFINYLKSKGYSKFERFGGKDRFETNSKIIDNLNILESTPVFLVDANNFQDALSVSSISAYKGYPIVITGTDELNESAKNILNKIKPSKLYIVDGNSKFSSKVSEDVKSLLPYLIVETRDNFGKTGNLITVNSKNYYDNSIKVCNRFDLKRDNYVLATGESYPDGLTGSVLAAKYNSPILLTNEDRKTKQLAHVFSNDLSGLYLLGGKTVISEDIENRLTGVLTGLDASASVSYETAKKMKADGISYVVRYYFDYDSSVNWKYSLTKEEAKDITRAGIKIVAVYQDGGKKIEYYTKEQGIKDCKKAIKNATEVGQPAGTPIYFTVDADIQSKDLSKCSDYFEGIKDTLEKESSNKWKIGVYGSKSVVEAMKQKLGQDTYIWQTRAWSADDLTSDYNIFQSIVDDNTETYDVKYNSRYSIPIDFDRSNPLKNNDIGSFQIN